MKAKSRFDRQVSASNARLTAISPKAIDWAYRNLVQHWAFRTPSGETACGECGHKFHHKGKSSFVKCPECGRLLKIKDTLKRKIEESTYFSTLETIDGLQVQRVSLLSVTYKKGKPKSVASVEICRLWLNANGLTHKHIEEPHTGSLSRLVQLGITHRTEIRNIGDPRHNIQHLHLSEADSYSRTKAQRHGH